MNPQTILTAFASAAVIGAVVGWCLRKRPSAAMWSLAIAAAAGWTLLHAPTLADLWRPLHPSAAIEWLPAVILVAAVVIAVTPDGRWRWALAAVLGVTIPCVLLWGSVHMRGWESMTQSPGRAVVLLGWGVSMAAIVGLHRDAAFARVSWSVVTWAVAVAAVAVLIATTGSVSYAAAVGTTGCGIVGVLATTGRLPIIAAVGLNLLVGLAAAFSELPVPSAAVVLLALIGLTFAAGERRTFVQTGDDAKSPAKVRPWLGPLTSVAALALIVMVSGQAASEFSKSSEDTGRGYGGGGYGGVPAKSSGTASRPIPSGDPAVNVSDEVRGPDQGTASTPDGDAPVDPFGGLGLP